jgi:hypothetical protein
MKRDIKGAVYYYQSIFLSFENQIDLFLNPRQ